MDDQNNSDIDEIKVLLDELKRCSKEGKDLLSILDPLSRNAEINKELFDNLAVEIQNTFKDIRASKSLNTSQFNAFKKQKELAEAQIREVKTAILDAKVILSTLKSIEKSAKTNQESIDSLKNQVAQKKSEVGDLHQSVKKIFSSISTLVGKADNHLVKIAEHKKASDEILKLLIKVKDQVNSNAKELEGLFKRGKEKFSSIEKAEREINNLFNGSKSNYLRIKAWVEKIFKPDGISSRIIHIENTIKAQQEEISRQLGQAASNRLCKIFEENTTELKSDLKGWRNGILFTVFCLLSLNASVLFGLEMSIPQRISIASPLVFLLVFCAFEYAKNKRFLEEYRFKHVAAYAMPAYFELIEERSSESALEYIVKTTQDIYANPSDKVYGKKGVKNNLFEYGLEILKRISKDKNVDVRALVEAGFEGFDSYKERKITLTQPKKKVETPTMVN